MRITVRLLFCGIALLAAADETFASDVLLYANGVPPPMLSTGATTDSGVAAPVDSNWSECQHPTGDLTISNTLSGLGGNPGMQRIADDFTVPALGWTLNAVDLYSYKTSAPPTPSPFVGYTLRIWGPCDPGTRPEDVGCTTVAFGDTTTNRFSSSSETGLFRVFNTVVPPASAPGSTRKVWRNRLTAGVTLAPGLYWLDWDSDAGGTHFDPPLTALGVRTVTGWNARQLLLAGTPAWVDALDQGQGPASPQPVAIDMPFELYGTGPLIFVDGFESEDTSAWSVVIP